LYSCCWTRTHVHIHTYTTCRGFTQVRHDCMPLSALFLLLAVTPV
jgi:hypothetical protein